MSLESDLSADYSKRITEASKRGIGLELVGGGSKRFYGRVPVGEPLDLSGHQGILSYEPRELVLTARAGTRLDIIEQTLRQQGQMLPFEPPHFGASATVGGTLSCGLSGPRRPYAGALRDFVLGARIINGRGDILRFGGEVMKNVAGYDASRLMAAAMGSLGVVLDVSFKVLPLPEREITLSQECGASQAITKMNQLSGQAFPISAASFDGIRLHIRISGAPKAVIAANNRIGGDTMKDDDCYWEQLREHQLPFFAHDLPLWRLSLPPTTPHLDEHQNQYIEWGGAQRWLLSKDDSSRIRALAARFGGHATLFRGGDHNGEVFHPLSQPLIGLHRRLKLAFDPQGIFNPGRLYREF